MDFVKVPWRGYMQIIQFAMRKSDLNDRFTAKTAMKSQGAKEPSTLPQSAVHQELEAHAQRLLVDQMKLRKLSYAELSERLAKLGIMETPDRLNRKVNRMKFQASFLLACLVAMNVQAVDLKAVDVSPEGRKQRLAKEAWLKKLQQTRRRRPLAPKPTKHQP